MERYREEFDVIKMVLEIEDLSERLRTARIYGLDPERDLGMMNFHEPPDEADHDASLSVK
jgi:hypothetical protein